MFTYLDGVETNLAFLIVKTTSRFQETERTLVWLTDSIINELIPTFPRNGNKITKSSSDYWSIASSACSTLSYDFIATNVSMQTDLKLQNKIKTVWICFGVSAYHAALNSLWLQNIYYRVLIIRYFPLKTGALNDCFLQNVCSKNQILTQNFHSSRKAEHF